MKEFIKNVAEIQARVKVPKKNRNDFGNYNYRSCGDILATLKPILKEYNYIVILKDEIEQIGDRFYVKATAKITDGEHEVDGKASAREPLTKKGMDDSQITGTASSYARKNALCGLLGIDEEKDSDITNKHVKEDDIKTINTNKIIKKNVFIINSFNDLKKCLESATSIKQLDFYRLNGNHQLKEKNIILSEEEINILKNTVDIMQKELIKNNS